MQQIDKEIREKNPANIKLLTNALTCVVESLMDPFMLTQALCSEFSWNDDHDVVLMRRRRMMSTEKCQCSRRSQTLVGVFIAAII